MEEEQSNKNILNTNTLLNTTDKNNVFLNFLASTAIPISNSLNSYMCITNKCLLASNF